MGKIRINGYCDPLNVRADEEIDFMISAENTKAVSSKIVRIAHGDENPLGPGFIENEVDSKFPDSLKVNRQFTQKGAFAKVEDKQDVLSLQESFTIFTFVRPNHLNGKRQSILGKWNINSNQGYGLGINPDGHFEFWMGNGTSVDKITSEVQILEKTWYFLCVTYNHKNSKVDLIQKGKINRYNSHFGPVVPYDYDSHISETFRLNINECKFDSDFIWAGATDFNKARQFFVTNLYNGKIDQSGIYEKVLSESEINTLLEGQKIHNENLIACWETSLGYTDDGIDDIIKDSGPNSLDAIGFNRPIRGMTGWNWAGKNDCFRLSPEEYGGIVFHDDALIDCNWKSNFKWKIPKNLPSGVYALKLNCKDIEEYIPFFIAPKKPKSKIAVLLPTFTYLAYANEHQPFWSPNCQTVTGHSPTLMESDIEMLKLAEFGLSTYDHHSDGSGCCFSSWRRPIANMRPKHRLSAMGFPWGLGADLSLLWWLENEGYDFEVITDHDLHKEGLPLLESYKVIINCTHPEYYSERMLDATEDYLSNGGRVIYSGGNGYYWVTAIKEDEPHCIEVRKLDYGSRSWQAFPGEGYLISTGECSGLWRARGRAPQKIVGIGLTAIGMDECQPFERMPDSFHRRVSWIFEGIGEKELIGDFGLVLDGAAGVEIDRYDLSLGTPPHALLLASSHGHSDNYPLSSEDIFFSLPGIGGTEEDRVRADIVFFNTANNGACLSIGSIAWSSSLPIDNGDNNVGKIMRNAIDAFSTEGELPGSKYVGDEKLWR